MYFYLVDDRSNTKFLLYTIHTPCHIIYLQFLDLRALLHPKVVLMPMLVGDDGS
jgi:hypothetical protein